MPTYISLISFTQKGVESIKEGPKRLDAAKERFRAAGAELKAFYLITGEYDAVAISEAPNDEVVVKLAMTRSSRESTSVTPRWNVPRSHARLLFERRGGDLVGRLRLEDRVAAGDKHDILLSLVDVGRWIGDRGRIDQRLPYHLSGFEIDRANPARCDSSRRRSKR